MQDEPRNISFPVPCTMRRMDHVRRDREVVVEELRAQRVVGDDAADLGGREKHHLRPLAREPIEHRGLVAEIELASISREQFDILAGQPPHQRAADHAAMAGDEDRLAFQLKRNACHWPTSRLASSRSLATMSFTSCAKLVFGFQPSFCRALLASPTSRSTSVGRK